MPKSTARAAPLPPPPTPAARVVFGLPCRVTRRPAGISSPVTAALQKIARAARSQIAAQWAVFPVHGRDVVVVGFATARTPRVDDIPTVIEPGAPSAMQHLVTNYMCWGGATVGRQGDDRTDADCVEGFARSLHDDPAWVDLGASPLDVRSLPGGDSIELPGPEFLLLTDDGRGADVVRGMSFWRAGDAYAAGRVQTWTRAVDRDETVRVVGVRAARVDAETPLRVAPPRQGMDADAWSEAVTRETRAVLDSPRPFGWYFIADEA